MRHIENPVEIDGHDVLPVLQDSLRVSRKLRRLMPALFTKIEA